MATEVGQAVIPIKPDLSEFGNGKMRSQIDGELNTASGGIKSWAKNVGAAIAGAFVVQKGFDFVKNSLDAAAESNRVAAQTDAALKSMGSSAGVTAKQVGDLAHRLQGVSGVEDETIQSGSNMLLTFGNIRNEVGKGNDIFTQATKTMLDMSVATGTDAKSSAIQLGKALNDPAKGAAALSRNGSLAKDDLGKLNEMAKAGVPILDQQKFILAALAKQYGGSAKAAGDAMTPMQRLSLSFGDIQEQVGTALLPVIEKFASFLSTTLIPAISGVAKFIGDNWKPIMIGLTAALVAAVPLFVALATAWWAANGAALASAAAIAAPIAAIALLAAGIYMLITHWQEVFAFLASVGSKILGFFADAASWLVDAGRNIIRGLLDGIVAYFELVKAFYIDLPIQILGYFATAATWLLDKGKDVLTGLWNGISGVWTGTVVPFFTGLMGVVVGYFADALTWLLEKGTNILSGLWNGITGIWTGTIEPFFYGLKMAVLGFFGDVGSWLLDKGKSLITGIWNGIKEVWAREVHFFSDLPTTITNAVGDIGSKMLGIGRSIVNGIIQGIRSVAGNIADAVLGAIPGGGIVRGALSHLPGFAAGVSNFSGGLAIVGERGPEVVNLPRGSDVIPNDVAFGGAHDMDYWDAVADRMASRYAATLRLQMRTA